MNPCLINGEWVQDMPLAYDRGLQYGDGVFRTLAVYENVAQDLDGQLDHLAADARRLSLVAPLKELRQEVTEAATRQVCGVIKILLTRGCGARGYRIREALQPNRLIYATSAPPDITKHQSQGVKAMLCETRLGRNPALAGIKHLNRLEQVMAGLELAETGFQEGILCDCEGQLVSALQGNLFLVRQGKLTTPELTHAGVRGRMRTRLIELANTLGLPVAEANLSVDDLNGADEVFLCNSVIGIWPLIECGAWTAAVGQITTQLQDHLAHPPLS